MDCLQNDSELLTELDAMMTQKMSRTVTSFSTMQGSAARGAMSPKTAMSLMQVCEFCDVIKHASV